MKGFCLCLLFHSALIGTRARCHEKCKCIHLKLANKTIFSATVLVWLRLNLTVINWDAKEKVCSNLHCIDLIRIKLLHSVGCLFSHFLRLLCPLFYQVASQFPRTYFIANSHLSSWHQYLQSKMALAVLQVVNVFVCTLFCDASSYYPL